MDASEARGHLQYSTTVVTDNGYIMFVGFHLIVDHEEMWSLMLFTPNMDL